jgi:hypothetical protein
VAQTTKRGPPRYCRDSCQAGRSRRISALLTTCYIRQISIVWIEWAGEGAHRWVDRQNDEKVA